MPTGIMAIAAHPGDALFSMGAAVARHIHNGGSGVFLSLSLGEKGHRTIPPVPYGEMQRAAMIKAAAMLRAQTEFLTYPDAGVPSGDRIAFEICDLIRKHRPAIVVTHWQGTWHKDHQNAYLAVRDGVFYAGLAAAQRDLPAHTPARLLFAENWEDASEFRPDIYLDISPVFDAWFKACAVFPMWRGETGLIRYDEHYRALAVMRGTLAGCQHAVTLMKDPSDRAAAVQTLDL